MKYCQKLFVLIALTIVSVNTHAALLYFTDRSEFESMLTTFEVDDFSSLTSRGQGYYSSAAFTYTGRMYGCTDSFVPGDTGCNYGSVFDTVGNKWIWTYDNASQFTTTNSVSAFGFDFAGAYTPYVVSGLSINGVATTDLSSGFFGVLSDDNSALGSVFNVAWGASSGFLGFDNVILSASVSLNNHGDSSNDVPEPSTILVFGLGLLALTAHRKMKV